MEHTGLIMSPAIDYVMTHELAHEWWYALISDDQARAPWLDEAFASLLGGGGRRPQRPWCRRPGPRTGLVTRGTAYFRQRALQRLRRGLLRGRVPARPAAPAHGRARVFDAALRAYAVANRYGWSTAAKFRAAMDAASPVPLDDLWGRYGVS